MEWTDESIARLRALWQEGLSTAEIGRRMGITKNAVVGKAHRLDLAARPSPIRKTEPQAGAVPPHSKRPAADKPRVADASVDTPQAVSLPTAPVQPATPDTVAVQPEAVAPIEVPVTEVAPVVVAQVSIPTPAPEIYEPEPAEPESSELGLPGNVRLLRAEMPNPAVAPAILRDEPKQDRAEAAVRPAPRATEPRRRGLTCCWPLGEPGTKGFHFCGADPTPGKPYCAEHAALAYVKLRDRRDSVA